MKIKPVLIESLQTEGLQIRPALNMSFVAELVEILKAGGKFRDALTVYRDPAGNYWVADGHHRLRAYIDAGSRTADCAVQAGSYTDALKHALGANAEHGQRRDDETIRRAIMTAYERRAELGLPDVPSANLIAQLVKCSDRTVSLQLRTVRSWAEAEARTGADGKTRRLPPPPMKPRRADLAKPPMPPLTDSDLNALNHRIEERRQELGRRRQAAKSEYCGDVPVDELGRRIPEKLLPVWQRAGEVVSMLSALSRIRTALKESQAMHDPLFAEVSFSSVLAHVDQAYSGIQVAKPYAVCPFCQGHGCRACFNSGILSKFRWDKTVPSDLKRQIMALIEKERAEQ